MTIDEIQYKDWRIEILHGEMGWKSLIYRPASPLHEVVVPEGVDRHAVIEEAKAQIDRAMN